MYRREREKKTSFWFNEIFSIHKYKQQCRAIWEQSTVWRRRQKKRWAKKASNVDMKAYIIKLKCYSSSCVFLSYFFLPLLSIFLISFTTVSRSFIEKIIYIHVCIKHVMLSLYMRLVKSRVVLMVWFASLWEFLLFANLLAMNGVFLLYFFAYLDCFWRFINFIIFAELLDKLLY